MTGLFSTPIEVQGEGLYSKDVTIVVFLFQGGIAKGNSME